MKRGVVTSFVVRVGYWTGRNGSAMTCRLRHKTCIGGH